MRTTPFFFLFSLVACSGDEFAPQEPAQPQAGAAGQTPAGQSGASPGGSTGQGGSPGGSGGTQTFAGQGGLSGSAGTSTGGAAGQAGSAGEQPGGQGGAAGISGSGGMQGGAAGAMLCEKGKFNCDGSKLQACKDPSKGFEDTVTCESEGQCSEKSGKCLECVPGSLVMCADKNTQLFCSPEGKKETLQPCIAPAIWCDMDGDFSCQDCLTDDQCPGNKGFYCLETGCKNNKCFSQYRPEGTEVPGSNTNPHDCQTSVCGQDGETAAESVPSEIPIDDQTDCYSVMCVEGYTMPQKTPVTDGTECTRVDGQGVCFDGFCAQCIPNLDPPRCKGNLIEGCAGGEWQAHPCQSNKPVCSKDQCTAVSDLALGDEHTCAVLTSGEVQCWGSNKYGQLGSAEPGNKPDQINSSIQPRLVAELSNVKQLSLGSSHSCALLQDGTVSCWGRNDKGQLGAGKKAVEPFPVNVAGLANITSIGAGGDTSCAINSNGNLICWGNGVDGQTFDFPSPSTFFPSPHQTSFPYKLSKVAVGLQHACGLSQTGEAFCWGNPEFTGGATVANPSVPVAPPFEELDVGNAHTCVRGSGQVTCWGSNAFGQLGINGPPPQFVFVTKFSEGSQLSLGGDHTCQIGTRDGKIAVECFGRQDGAQLGQYDATKELGLNFKDAIKLSSGKSHNCIITTEGAVQCWGTNISSQLGFAMGQNFASDPSSVVWLTEKLEMKNKIISCLSSIALLSIFPACGGDELAPQEPSAGAAGSGAATNSGGSAGASGSAGQGGSAAGSPTAGSAGAGAGQGGSSAGQGGAGQGGAGQGGSDAAGGGQGGTGGLGGQGGAGQGGAGQGGGAACKEGEFSCLKDLLRVCNAQGEFQIKDTCETDLCDAVSGTCLFCKPGKVAGCATPPPSEPQNKLKVCNAAGDSYEEIACEAPNIACVEGKCVQCTQDTDCGTPGPCFEPTCVQNKCGSKPHEAGFILPDTSVGDCHHFECNGSGISEEFVDDDDTPPQDANVCDQELCQGGIEKSTPTPVGGTCKQLSGDDGYCNGFGTCGECLPNARFCGEGSDLYVCSGSGKNEPTSCQGVTPACSDGDCRGVTKIVAGDNHNCAILSNKRVNCWGLNSHGQIGNGDSGLDKTGAGEVVGLANVIDIAAGDQHSCAIVAGGKVFCWGNNEFGQLGAGKDAPGIAVTPIEVKGLEGVTAISAGAGFSCALDIDGKVFCWGNNDAIQLGKNPAGPPQLEPYATPVSPSVLLASGRRRTCVYTKNSEVYCWGTFDYILNGNVTYSSQPPVLVPGISGVKSLDVGGDHTCAYATPQSIFCWDRNDEGQLGQGVFSNYESPAGTLFGKADPVQMALGHDFTCALLGDKVKCAGSNKFGQLGRGSLTPVNDPEPKNVMEGNPLKPLTGMAQIAAGKSHVCGLTTEGFVKCWGDNKFGQSLFKPSNNINTSPLTVNFIE